MAKVSIITITYNAEKVLERTIKSVVSQAFRDFEYIIVDGDSKDGTKAICEQYSQHIDIFSSEKDDGIYDAMNKGLRLANGDFVWFMNAGDEIATSKTLSNIFSKVSAKTDLVYGDALFVNDDGVARGLRSVLTPHKLKADINWRDLRFGMLVCHQSLLVHRSIAPTYIIDNFSADVDWEIKSFKASTNQVFLEEPLANFLEGGVSNQQLEKSLKDRFIVLKNHFGLIPTLFNHLIILVRGLKKIWTSKGKYW
ncbi:glycosyltransferase family 2 protein [Arcticibacterium luteifluviistationis]|uniref:Glycosyl transferase n=1 Tax=Arcticibacterium luteifluviistationis TaxID=1784714 RepID=A0A2Z4G819_9BACT|nr:glycosyltransferase family 2 protein [Arcticibacterium luteifluviistationis]AWV97245.1 glycosyl transferase [Arcticibacterium luteifluviistationis]